MGVVGERVKLADVCNKASSNYAQKDLDELEGEYPVFGASGYLKSINQYHQAHEYIAVVKDGAGIGRTMFLPAKSSIIGTMQYLIPKDNIIPKYLYYAVKNMHLERYYSGATIPHIYFKDYQKEEFNLPDAASQQETVDILERIEKLIEQRRKQLEYFDTLIKARFVEIFGDPVSNSKNWERATFNDCLESIDNGKSFVCSTDARKGNEPAILKLSAATYGVFKPEENKAILDADDFVESSEVHCGDLLFTRKNTPELVGTAAYVYDTPEKLMMPDLIFRLNTNECCNKVFLWQLINHDLFRGEIQKISSGSAKSMSNISKERLKSLELYLPPIALQLEFERFVAQIDKSKFRILIPLSLSEQAFACAEIFTFSKYKV